MPELKPRILIVDDDPIVTESLRDFVIAEGHEAATANSAAEALEGRSRRPRGRAVPLERREAIPRGRGRSRW